jgi:hypothetical protein
MTIKIAVATIRLGKQSLKARLTSIARSSEYTGALRSVEHIMECIKVSQAKLTGELFARISLSCVSR